jgi:hypothetical protein
VGVVYIDSTLIGLLCEDCVNSFKTIADAKSAHELKMEHAPVIAAQKSNTKLAIQPQELTMIHLPAAQPERVVSRKFKSKLEAYSNALIELYNLKSEYKNNSVATCIEKIKIAFENHEQNIIVVCQYLEDLQKELLPSHQVIIKDLIHHILNSEYKQTPLEKYENPLARRAESDLFSVMLTQPTPAMMKSVLSVSQGILNIIKKYGYMVNEVSPSVFIKSDFKYFDEKMLVKTLASTDPKDFLTLMQIHQNFAMGTAQNYPINPVKLRIKILTSSLFRAEGDEKGSDRGRLGRGYERSSNFGVMLSSQYRFSSGLSSSLRSDWSPDAVSRYPNMNSAYVIDMIENDAVYVAGPSGTTACYMDMIESWVKFESDAEKQNYLMAIATFIVGTGWHSLHEVLEAAAFVPNLVPAEYKISVPNKEILASAPMYHAFFAQQKINNPGFDKNRELAWRRYLTFFNETYAPKLVSGYKKSTNRLLVSHNVSGLFSACVSVEDSTVDIHTMAAKSGTNCTIL